MEDLELEFEESQEVSKDSPHLSDILVTQMVLCIAIVVGVFILNLVKPTYCEYLVDTFKYYTSIDLSKGVKYILAWLYDRV